MMLYGDDSVSGGLVYQLYGVVRTDIPFRPVILEKIRGTRQEIGIGIMLGIGRGDASLVRYAICRCRRFVGARHIERAFSPFGEVLLFHYDHSFFCFG